MMRTFTKMITISATCVALAAGSLFAVSGERATALQASPVDLAKLATLAADAAEEKTNAVATTAIATVPIEADVSPIAAVTPDVVPAEETLVAASKLTLEDVPAVELDWPTAAAPSASAYKKTKMDRGVFRSIEFVNNAKR